MAALPDARHAADTRWQPGSGRQSAEGSQRHSGVWQAEYAPPGENERLFGDGFKDFVVPGDDPRTFSKYFLNILADRQLSSFQNHSNAGRDRGAV